MPFSVPAPLFIRVLCNKNNQARKAHSPTHARKHQHATSIHIGTTSGRNVDTPLPPPHPNTNQIVFHTECEPE